MRTYEDIEFAKPGERALLLDVYLPDSTSAKTPVVVWSHGGGWRGGDKTNVRGLSFPDCGIAVVSISYRLSHEAIWPAQIHDCKAGVRWVHAHAEQYGFDTERVGVWGSSAGGHLAAMVAVTNGDPAMEGDVGWGDHPSTVHACANWCGPTDNTRLGEAAWQVPRQDVIVEVTEALVGGPLLGQRLAMARDASPIAHVKPGCVPILTMQGLADDVVAPAHAQPFHDAMIACGNASELHLLEDAPHGFWTPEREAVVCEFFKRTLSIEGRLRSA